MVLKSWLREPGSVVSEASLRKQHSFTKQRFYRRQERHHIFRADQAHIRCGSQHTNACIKQFNLAWFLSLHYDVVYTFCFSRLLLFFALHCFCTLLIFFNPYSLLHLLSSVTTRLDKKLRDFRDCIKDLYVCLSTAQPQHALTHKLALLKSIKRQVFALG